MKVYQLHRAAGGSRCCAISPEGRRCQKAAAWSRAYHGDPEWGAGPPWVLTDLCDDHAREVWWPDFKKRSKK